MFKIEKHPEFKEMVTFLPNRTEPIHNWYWYKEGYSKELVEVLFKRFDVKEGVVLDPFCGVGTSLLTAKQNGLKGIGFDTSPLCTFISKVKTRNYDLDELEKYVKEARGWRPVIQKKLPSDKFLRKGYSKYALGDTLFYKKKIFEIEDEKIRNFLLLGLIDSSIKASYIYKDGSVVKIRKGKRPPVKILFKNKIRRMFKQLQLERDGIEPRVVIGDARKLDLEDESVDFVITSPPYLNKIEYTNIYKLEYSLFFDLPAVKLKSHISDNPEEINEEFSDLPLIAQNYFSDMKKVMEELYRVCKKDAKLAIVIGGGCFPDQAIIVDEVLANISEKIGFEVKSIDVARESWCTRNRTEKVGRIRESVIILEK